MLKVSKLLKTKISPFLYGCLLSRIMNESLNGQEYFYCYTHFKISKFVSVNEFNITKYVKHQLIDALNYFSHLHD